MKENVSYWKFFKSFWSVKGVVEWFTFSAAVMLALNVIAQYPFDINLDDKILSILSIYIISVTATFVSLMLVSAFIDLVFTLCLLVDMTFGNTRIARRYYNARVRKETYEEWKE